ncbi:MAG: DegT/DnrJ/EryC1/StrS family aminotransferase [Proteobacteria bacterium]|nr:DegT/DnrJ/EryC1/StrS family aminotransferase [Pseudomonadota bacterium]
MRAAEEKPFLPFSKPTFNEDEIQEVIQCLKSGWITTGPRVQKFEEDLKNYLNCPYVLSLASGTAGLYIALKALNLQEEDEVITTAFTFVATLNTIVMAGGKPILVDIDPKTYNIDISKIEEAITSKTRVILPVHFAGLSVDLDPLYDLAKKYNLVVIEDAAQAIGTCYKNKRIGAFGDMQVFSFHPNKNITTIEGGALSLHHDRFLKKLSTARFHGIDRDIWDRFTKKGSQHYDVVEPALKFNMSDVQAGIGIHQLKKLENFIDQRAKLATRYLEKLNAWPELILPPHLQNFEHKHSWHLFAPCLNIEYVGFSRDDLIQKMKDLGIGIGLHYDAPHLFTYYQKNFGYKVGDFPNSEWVSERIFSLPLFPLMSEEDQDRVIESLSIIFNKNI